MNPFSKIFKKNKEATQMQSVNINGGAIFTAWNGNAYENDIYRSGVDAIARNSAKLKGGHVVKYNDHNKVDGDCKLNRLLQIQPNPYMSAYDMLYKLITHYYLYNNAFAYLQRENGQLVGVYPLHANTIDFVADASGTLYCKFWFANGTETILPYSDIVHLRRNFNDNDLLGNDNAALSPALELAHTQNEGIVNGIKTGANIRGILHIDQLLADSKLKEARDNFMVDYLSMANDGGVVVTDNKMTYSPIDAKGITVDEKQMQAAKQKIFNYLGVSESIVNSTYDEDTWAAFYESTIEPIATQLSLEFTRKIFTDREQAFGNSILFESGRLQFSSNLSKIRLINTLMPYGLLTVNQALEIMNLPPVENGDKRLQTLNMVDANQANQYQMPNTKIDKEGVEI